MVSDVLFLARLNAVVVVMGMILVEEGLIKVFGMMREGLQGLVVVVPLTQLLVSHLLFLGLTNPLAWLHRKHTNNSEIQR